MQTHKIVSREEWIKARKELLIKEKQFTRLRDELSAERRELPWVKVEKEYIFDNTGRALTLLDLFKDKSQLLIYHFMLGPDWEDGCKSCSFWADNFNGIDIHLAHRDISFLAISRADQNKIDAYKQRMGWSFNWLSSFDSDFNYDFGVSFTEKEKSANEITYNYIKQPYFISTLR